MAFHGYADDGEEGGLVAGINVTPLVDVMLVLLIIFLITIPVAIHSVPVRLPNEANQPTETHPDTVTIAVDRDGAIYWNEQRMTDSAMLRDRLHVVAAVDPQPEIHIRADREVRYRAVAKVVAACQRVGVIKLGFITEPQPRGD